MNCDRTCLAVREENELRSADQYEAYSLNKRTPAIVQRRLERERFSVARHANMRIAIVFEETEWLVTIQTPGTVGESENSGSEALALFSSAKAPMAI